MEVTGTCASARSRPKVWRIDGSDPDAGLMAVVRQAILNASDRQPLTEAVDKDGRLLRGGATSNHFFKAVRG